MGKKIQPRRGMSVAITVLSDPYATVAQAVLVDTGLGILDGVGLFVATGAAKKEPGDVYDPVIDMDLAAGRALVRLGGQMILSGNARVRESTLERSKKNVAAKLQRRGRHAKDNHRLGLAEIKELYGDEAASRAARRRERHARDAT